MAAGCLMMLGLVISGCSGRIETRYAGATMGTSYHITVCHGFFKRPFGLHKKIEAKLADINRSMSTFDPDSEISRFNRLQKALVAFPVSPDFFRVLQAARKLNRMTEGAWDGTVKPLVDLWGFGAAGRTNKPPSDAAVAACRRRVGFDLIELLPNGVVRKHDPLVTLDLASIAKGYAVDAVSRIIRQRGYENFLVEIGGEVFAAGRRKDGGPWRIGINRPAPDASANDVYRVVHISNRAMATSGDYRNYFEKNGVRYSHVIDPRTGRPVANQVVSATILADDCMLADGLATAVMVLGSEKGLALINRLAAVEGLVLAVDDNGITERSSRGFDRFVSGTQ